MIMRRLLVDSIANFSFYLLRLIFRFNNWILDCYPSSSPCASSSQAPLRIVIWFQSGIGDYLMFTPALRSIRSSFPTVHITLWTPESSPIPEFVRYSDQIDTYVEHSLKASLPSRLNSLLRLARSRPHIFLNASPADCIDIPLFCILARVRIRIGFTGDDKWRSRYHFVYNRVAEMVKNETDRGLRLAECLGANINVCESKSPILKLPDSALAHALKRFPEQTGERVKGLICIQPGSSEHQKWKRWHISKYKELMTILLETTRADVALVGGKEERHLVTELLESRSPRVHDLVGRISLSETAAIIAISDVVVCGDSSTMHISAALKTPCVAIYGPTDVSRTIPYGDSVVPIAARLPCSPCFRPNDSHIAENCPIGYLCLQSVGAASVAEAIRGRMEIRSLDLHDQISRCHIDQPKTSN